jgi:8-oxo-dGTP diphosphatase
MAGFWEFPGGKREPREPRRQALARELAEELGIDVIAAEPFMTLAHDYGDRHVALDVWSVSAYSGEPRGREGQELAWHPPAALGEIGLLPADAGIVAHLLERSARVPSSATAGS